jgi:hypothetical protein
VPLIYIYEEKGKLKWLRDKELIKSNLGITKFFNI